MQEDLVIAENPTKVETIEKFLSKDYEVMLSYGHIRDLKRKELSIDLDTLNSDYEIPDEKKKIVNELRKNARAADKVWLAPDEDRKGEAISWHLCEILGLDGGKTSRIVFHETTKPVILETIGSPRRLGMSLVNAQQARRVFDRLVGFRLSPVLWYKVKPVLNIGRMQSIAVRLTAKHEHETQSFNSEPCYHLNAVFAATSEDGSKNEVRAELSRRFKTHEETLAFLGPCKTSKFKVSPITKKPLKRAPAPPSTTSVLQQEAIRELGFTVSQMMMTAQRLYETGCITYMRTDNVNLSAFTIEGRKIKIERLYGEDYGKVREYQTHSKSAQETHEAIHPTYIDNAPIEGIGQEKRLYGLIQKRTIASQVVGARIGETTVNISLRSEEAKNTIDLQFIANGEVIAFEGSLRVYHELTGNGGNSEESSHALPVIHKGEELECCEIVSTERYSQGPNRYTEASLTCKLEELDIGRPSTYALTISTIQQREYVQKGDRKDEERKHVVDSLLGLKITSKTKKKMAGVGRGKPIPTDVGIVVNDFPMSNFPDIMDCNFTAKIEQEFDRIAEGKAEWNEEMKASCQSFESEVEKVMNARPEYKTGERELGVDPATGKPAFVKIGHFGPAVQIGSADDEDKPRLLRLPSDKSMEAIILDETLELLKLSRDLGQFEGTDVMISAGCFDPYVLHDKKYTSLPKEGDPLTISPDAAINLIQKKCLQDTRRHLKTSEGDAKMEVMNGRYGPYTIYNGKNYRMPETLHDRAAELAYEQCTDIIKNASEPKRKK